MSSELGRTCIRSVHSSQSHNCFHVAESPSLNVDSLSSSRFSASVFCDFHYGGISHLKFIFFSVLNRLMNRIIFFSTGLLMHS